MILIDHAVNEKKFEKQQDNISNHTKQATPAANCQS
jgi:hypothetical protein